MKPWVLVIAFLAGGAVVPLLGPEKSSARTVSAAVADFVNSPSASDLVGGDTIGRSVEGRTLKAEDLGRGPLRVYIVGGVHGEPPALRPLDDLRSLMRQSSIASQMTVRLLEDLNPDGTARGLFCNANKVDIDRNFPSKDFKPTLRHGLSPLSEPESEAFWRDVRAFRPDLVVVLQSAMAGPFLDGDGPSDAYGMQFVSGASAVDDRWTLLGDKGYAFSGSMGSALGTDLGIPVLNLRFRRDQDAKSVADALKAGLSSLASRS